MRGKRTKKRQRKPSQVSIRSGQVEFVKVGTDAWRWRDVYRWLLGLRWPQFAAFVASLYVGAKPFFRHALQSAAKQYCRQHWWALVF